MGLVSGDNRDVRRYFLSFRGLNSKAFPPESIRRMALKTDTCTNFLKNYFQIAKYIVWSQKSPLCNSAASDFHNRKTSQNRISIGKCLILFSTTACIPTHLLRCDCPREFHSQHALPSMPSFGEGESHAAGSPQPRSPPTSAASFRRAIGAEPGGRATRTTGAARDHPLSLSSLTSLFCTCLLKALFETSKKYQNVFSLGMHSVNE